jgi:hypothetical protein
MTNPVVHLELHTHNLSRACAFYTSLFRWQAENVRVGNGSYLALDLVEGIEAGIVERELELPLWLPYVEVSDVMQATDLALRLGAELVVEPREGPAGWRSVLAGPAAAQIALWEPKNSAE